MTTVFDLAGFETVDLLKIDVEGAERSLFADAELWLQRVRAIAIEFHDDTRAASRFDDVMGGEDFELRDDVGHTVLAVRRSAR